MRCVQLSIVMEDDDGHADVESYKMGHWEPFGSMLTGMLHAWVENGMLVPLFRDGPVFGKVTEIEDAEYVAMTDGGYLLTQEGRTVGLDYLCPDPMYRDCFSCRDDNDRGPRYNLRITVETVRRPQTKAQQNGARGKR